MKKYLYSLMLILTVLHTLSFARTRTMDRKYIPIIVSNLQSPLINLKYGDLTGTTIKDRDLTYLWHAYKYNAAKDQWTAVPWQIDELDSTDTKYNKHEFIDGIIDIHCELLMMPEDLGDRRCPNGCRRARWIRTASNWNLRIRWTAPKRAGCTCTRMWFRSRR